MMSASVLFGPRFPLRAAIRLVNGSRGSANRPLCMSKGAVPSILKLRSWYGFFMSDLPDWRQPHHVDRDQWSVGVAFRTLVAGDDLVMLPTERDQIFQPVQVP